MHPFNEIAEPSSWKLPYKMQVEGFYYWLVLAAFLSPLKSCSRHFWEREMEDLGLDWGWGTGSACGLDPTFSQAPQASSTGAWRCPPQLSVTDTVMTSGETFSFVWAFKIKFCRQKPRGLQALTVSWLVGSANYAFGRDLSPVRLAWLRGNVLVGHFGFMVLEVPHCWSWLSIARSALIYWCNTTLNVNEC